MKKKLEAELISIAHRVLKLNNRADIDQLQQETLKLYEKLSVLKFVEDNFGEVKPTIGYASAEAMVEEVYNAPVKEEAKVVEEPAIVEEVKEVQPEPVVEVEEEKVVVAEEPETPVATMEVIEEEKAPVKEETPDQPLFDIAFDKKEDVEEPVAKKEVSIEDFQDYQEPEFVKRTEETAEVEETPVANNWQNWEPKAEEPVATSTETAPETQTIAETRSLNDAFSKTIDIGLNDRIAFEKHLFNGSGEDLNRVLSQLNTLTKFSDARTFIKDLVKPDYNNWADKEEYEERFMGMVEKKFD
ncbi:MAG: hypothetical protein BM557_11285 [Flavobacterium sp. MedPE-SWcel]|uniref:hypothetical protein n=1 Tax=uncultured Flavobacterium sp. TaxID=165435 RepID=UPI00091697C0|nr:hypothetical protein [uncultured Flavobacterium sp.]OIQ15420.1 MAG: hypothetical protein BM557_11285 [Flavobacterium sp. MedPE-SWcel]